MNGFIGINELMPGERAKVLYIDTEGSMRRRLLDIGLVKDTLIECVGKSPMGDPSAYYIRGAVMAIRADDGRKIIAERCGVSNDGQS